MTNISEDKVRELNSYIDSQIENEQLDAKDVIMYMKKTMRFLSQYTTSSDQLSVSILDEIEWTVMDMQSYRPELFPNDNQIEKLLEDY